MRIRVEVADTPYKLATGLMNRRSLAPDGGMLFVFSRPQVLSFWGQNTFIPLDIAFIDNGHTVVKIARINKLDQKAVTSDVKCIMAVEVNAGFCREHGISIGDQIRIDADKYQGTFVTFEKNAGESTENAEQQVKVAQTKRRWDNQIPLGTTKQVKVAKPQGGWSWNGKLPNQVFQTDKKIPLPDWMNDAFEGQGNYEQTQPPAAQNGFGPASAPMPQDENDLPVMNLDDFGFADDDYDDEASDADEQMADDAVEEPQPGEEEETPDASQMDTYDALEEAINEGLVLMITYTTAPKKRTIGPVTAPKTITRTVQPHGVIHARTTGNNVLVTWDMSMNDFRAFIVDRINDKRFTGQHFKKWFRVQG